MVCRKKKIRPTSREHNSLLNETQVNYIPDRFVSVGTKFSIRSQVSRKMIRSRGASILTMSEWSSFALLSTEPANRACLAIDSPPYCKTETVTTKSGTARTLPVPVITGCGSQFNFPGISLMPLISGLTGMEGTRTDDGRSKVCHRRDYKRANNTKTK